MRDPVVVALDFDGVLQGLVQVLVPACALGRGPPEGVLFEVKQFDLVAK